MKTTFSLFFLLLCRISFSQISGVVINSETKQPIPYVNICLLGKDIGTSANENGSFLLEKATYADSVIFSAIGFKTVVLLANGSFKKVPLNPVTIAIDEVVVTNKKISKEINIGDVSKGRKKIGFQSNNNPWILGRSFKYKDEYSKAPYLKTIKVLTRNDIHRAKFNVRIYTLNPDSTPGELLHNKNIIATAKGGLKVTSIDVSDLNILFPESGLFVAVEALIIESNKYEYVYTNVGSSKRHNGVSYEPDFEMYYVADYNNSWMYSIRSNKWSLYDYKSFKTDNERSYTQLAMELTLTN